MMTPTTKSMKLFVKWKRGQNPAWDDPIEIRWEDGRRATLADYIHHFVDTPKTLAARVSYDTRTQQFTLFADRCLMKKDFVDRIMKWMNLPKVKTDPHYQCNRVCLRGAPAEL